MILLGCALGRMREDMPGRRLGMAFEAEPLAVRVCPAAYADAEVVSSGLAVFT